MTGTLRFEDERGSGLPTPSPSDNETTSPPPNNETTPTTLGDVTESARTVTGTPAEMPEGVGDATIALRVVQIAALLLPVFVFVLQYLGDADAISGETADNLLRIVPVAGMLTALAAVLSSFRLADTSDSLLTTLSLLMLAVVFLIIAFAQVYPIFEQIPDEGQSVRRDESVRERTVRLVCEWLCESKSPGRAGGRSGGPDSESVEEASGADDPENVNAPDGEQGAESDTAAGRGE